MFIFFLALRILLLLPKLSFNFVSLVTCKHLVQFIKHNIPDIYSLYRPAFQWQRCSGPHWESVKKSLGSGNSIDVSICCFFLFFFAFFFFSFLLKQVGIVGLCSLLFVHSPPPRQQKRAPALGAERGACTVHQAWPGCSTTAQQLLFCVSAKSSYFFFL